MRKALTEDAWRRMTIPLVAMEFEESVGGTVSSGADMVNSVVRPLIEDKKVFY